MCTRYQLSKKDLARLAGNSLAAAVAKFEDRYNISPGTKIPAVRRTRGAPASELALLRWGLVPEWASSNRSASPFVNARAETISAKPAFRNAFEKRRCLIPVSGFFEWQIEGRRRLPWHFQLRDQQPFFLAGIWETTLGTTEEPLETCAVITTEPNDLMRPIHSRMPAIVRAEFAEAWLRSTAETNHEIQSCLRPFSAAEMTAQRISPRVNSVMNDDPACLQPPDTTTDGEQQLFPL
ncbi:MAG: SOS response-associated peptidase [Nibricoccus sp.]